MLAEIGWRPNDDALDLVADTHGNHVADHMLAQLNARIEMTRGPADNLDSVRAEMLLAASIDSSRLRALMAPPSESAGIVATTAKLSAIKIGLRRTDSAARNGHRLMAVASGRLGYFMSGSTNLDSASRQLASPFARSRMQRYPASSAEGANSGEAQ
jgi:hypothetical protein